jgi:hypothetical protein
MRPYHDSSKEREAGNALCYASIERLWKHEGGLREKVLRGSARGVSLRRNDRKSLGPTRWSTEPGRGG